MKIKSITRSVSISRPSPYELDSCCKTFDAEIARFCVGKDVVDVKTVVSQDGTSNWQGGVHNIVLNAIIRYNE